jgi:hypothetical protein
MIPGIDHEKHLQPTRRGANAALLAFFGAAAFAAPALAQNSARDAGAEAVRPDQGPARHHRPGQQEP